MIRWVKYHYHSWMADRLNADTRVLSALMRSHPDPEIRSLAAKDLLSVGARSNYHEKQRDANRGRSA